MSLMYNGDRSTNNSLPEQEEEGWGSRSSNEEFNTSEEEFRGFEKIPLVICERYDITPYLDKYKRRMVNKKIVRPPDPMKMEYAPRISNEAQFAKILHECSVILVRDDLEQLKELVKNKSPILNGTTGLKCKICDKEYSSDKKLQNHIENKHIIYKSPNKTPKRVSFSDHIIVHEVKEYHRCRKCPKIFENYNTLKLHMKQKHKKRKCYVCHYCSKDFVDRMFFKVHIKLHCDVCGLFLSNRKKYLEHRRQVCRVLKKYQCKTCHMQFFNFMDLKDHNYDHLGIYFICDVCKDQFRSKCAVAHHIQFLHSNKRPDLLYLTKTVGSDKVFICNFCEESAIEMETIENHVSTLPDLQNRATTGYNDYYFCDQCLKKFSTEKDMLQHKWSHFLKTSNTEIKENDKKPMKLVYKMYEELPKLLQPKIVLEKLELPNEELTISEDVQLKTIESSEITLNLNESLRKAIVDPVSKKTILSKHQCVTCGKYLSSNYCLTRHMLSVHGVNKDGTVSNLQCPLCEEIFVWPSLLRSHKCIRLNYPEMPFEDARPEVHFDNLNSYMLDDFNQELGINDDDYMNSVDFEIPAPIVELTEYENVSIVLNGDPGPLNIMESDKVNNLGYKVMLQEVPIEF